MNVTHDTSGLTPSAQGVTGLVARLLRLPIAAFVFGMEMFVVTLQGLQRFTDDGLEAVAGAGAVPTVRDGAGPAARADPGDRRDTDLTTDTGTSNRQKEPPMPDTNLNDDMLKLVRYKILFVKREYEVAFPEQEELIYDNLTDTGFVAWKIAEFIQHLGDTSLPPKWRNKNYPANQAEQPGDPAIVRKWQDEKARGGDRRVHWLPEGDKKFLRVYYEVLARYTRERFKHDERQIEVLEQIRDGIDNLGDTLPPAIGSGAAKGGAPKTP